MRITDFLCVQWIIYIYARDLSKVPIHGDETTHISTSYYFESFLFGPSAKHPWITDYWLMTMPLVPRYIIGLSRWLAGYGLDRLNTTSWDWKLTTEANILTSAMPSPGLLWWSRFPMALLAIGSMLIIYAWLHKSFGRFSAYLWVIFCTVNAYLLLTLRRALSESPLVFFAVITMIMMVLTCYVFDLYRIGKACKWHIFGCGVALGVCAGLSTAAKLNGVATIFAIGLMIIYYLRGLNVPIHLKILCSISAIALISFVALAVFVALHPHTWQSPVQITWAMFVQRANEMSGQVRDTVTYNLSRLNRKIEIVPMRVLNDYASLKISDNKPINIAINGIVAMCSLIFLQKKLRAEPQANITSHSIVVIFAMGFVMGVPALFTPLDWDRYYIMPIFFLTILSTIGLGQLFLQIGNRIWSAFVKYRA